jgi:hypothetical protein
MGISCAKAKSQTEKNYKKGEENRSLGGTQAANPIQGAAVWSQNVAIPDN